MAQTYGELFAANLRAARARANLSQTTVAARMARLGFPAWDGSTVSKSERGVRPVLVAELLALAVALETTIGDLVGANAPPMAVVEFPEPVFQLTGVNVRNSAFNFNDGATTWEGDHLLIIRPANVWSAAATDKTHLARTATTVEQIKREHPELTRQAS